MTLPQFIATLLGQVPPGLPGWYRAFAIVDSLVMFGAIVGLWRLRRWGFGLLALAYASAVLAMLVARLPFNCPVLIMSVFFMMAASQWKVLR